MLRDGVFSPDNRAEEGNVSCRKILAEKNLPLTGNNMRRKKMARIKPMTGKLESLEDVNLALRDIGLAERELTQIDTEAHKKIAEIKTAAAEKGEALRKRIAELSTKIQAYSDYNRDELFKDRKTVELSFGIFGYRKSTKISVKKTTLELLKTLAEKKRSLLKCVRIKEEVDKDELGKLDNETLLQVDAVRKTSDDFFCEANTEEVNRELLNA